MVASSQTRKSLNGTDSQGAQSQQSFQATVAKRLEMKEKQHKRLTTVGIMSHKVIVINFDSDALKYMTAGLNDLSQAVYVYSGDVTALKVRVSPYGRSDRCKIMDGKGSFLLRIGSSTIDASNAPVPTKPIWSIEKQRDDIGPYIIIYPGPEFATHVCKDAARQVFNDFSTRVIMHDDPKNVLLSDKYVAEWEAWLDKQTQVPAGDEENAPIQDETPAKGTSGRIEGTPNPVLEVESAETETDAGVRTRTHSANEEEEREQQPPTLEEVVAAIRTANDLIERLDENYEVYIRDDGYIGLRVREVRYKEIEV